MKGIDLNAAEMKRQVAAFYNADGNSALYSINVEQLIPEYMKMLSVIVDVIKAQDYTGTKFADMGCGNGTLDEMLLKNMHSIKVHCVDSSKGMLDIARRNLENYPGRVEFFQNDI
ncbi:MAG: methyltransferase domain-containing protein, partial [Nanoarchaeota archaeon]|nr:methyltransferase domain-containing protein [Nanoarchaeota archaeon]